MITYSVAARRRGRKRLKGVARTPSGAISRAKPERLEPIPEQVAKHQAQGTRHGADSFDCVWHIWHRLGLLTEVERSAADALEAKLRSYLAAIGMPGRGHDSLAAMQPRGGAMTDEQALQAESAYRSAINAVTEAEGSHVANQLRRMLGGQQSVEIEKIKAGLAVLLR